MESREGKKTVGVKWGRRKGSLSHITLIDSYKAHSLYPSFT